MVDAAPVIPRYSLDFPGGTVVVNNSLSVASLQNLNSSDRCFFMKVRYETLTTGATRNYLIAQTGAGGIFGNKGGSPAGKFGIDDGSTIQPFTTIPSLLTWYSLMLNFNTTTKQWNLYVNGVVDATTVTVTPPTSTNAFIFGHHHSQTLWGFDGAIYQIYELNRLGTVDEALAHHSLDVVPSGAYAFKYPMTEGTGNPIDTSGNGIVATKGSLVTWNSVLVP